MSNIKLFESKQIRSVWNEEEQKWYFSVQDIIKILTYTINAKDYIKKMRKRDTELNSNWGTISPPVEMVAADGKKRKVQAANTKGLLRIIQSIPSPKAEPFKLWLAQVGSDRLDEIENPELAAPYTWELKERRELKIKNIFKLINYKYILAKTNLYLYSIAPPLKAWQLNYIVYGFSQRNNHSFSIRNCCIEPINDYSGVKP